MARKIIDSKKPPVLWSDLKEAIDDINDNFQELYTSGPGGSVDLSNVNQDIVPDTTETRDIGTPTKRWKDIYLSGNSIDLGGAIITRTDDGNVVVPGLTVGTRQPSTLTATASPIAGPFVGTPIIIDNLTAVIATNIAYVSDQDYTPTVYTPTLNGFNEITSIAITTPSPYKINGTVTVDEYATLNNNVMYALPAGTDINNWTSIANAISSATSPYGQIPCSVTESESITLFETTVQGLQGVQGTQGTQGVRGSLGNQGIQGVQGVQGGQGSPGNLGSQGIQGVQGANGSIGAQGITGGTGPQGIQGIVGSIGGQGVQGTQGTQGTQGRQGITGSSGGQGVQGRQGIQGTNGLSFNQGIQGLQGEQGTQGIQGSVGTQGIQGIQGTQGSQGEQGIQGNDGQSYNQGIQGVQGEQGTQGVQGGTGTQGIQGIQGIIGQNGIGVSSIILVGGELVINYDDSTSSNVGSVIGPQGIQGVQGVDGLFAGQGIQGITGDQGVQGITGEQGVQGIQGEPGNQGITGNQGLQGLQGIQGLDGAFASQGIQGTQGISGTAILTSRITVNATASNLGSDAIANLDLTGFKGYALYKIETSDPAWIRVYTDGASRTADSGRTEGNPPLQGSGVIAEIITTQGESVRLGPAVIGYNNENPVTNIIPISVKNKSGVTNTITVTLTILKVEE